MQFLQNNNLEITTGIIHHLYTKPQEINGADLNNRTKSFVRFEANRGKTNLYAENAKSTVISTLVFV